MGTLFPWPRLTDRPAANITSMVRDEVTITASSALTLFKFVQLISDLKHQTVSRACCYDKARIQKLKEKKLETLKFGQNFTTSISIFFNKLLKKQAIISFLHIFTPVSATIKANLPSC